MGRVRGPDTASPFVRDQRLHAPARTPCMMGQMPSSDSLACCVPMRVSRMASAGVTGGAGQGPWPQEIL
jgi:hypothetical protein